MSFGDAKLVNAHVNSKIGRNWDTKTTTIIKSGELF